MSTAAGAPTDNRAWRRGLALALVLFALAVRIQRAWIQPVVNSDCLRFVRQAKMLPVHPLLAVRREVYHPLQAVAGLLVHACLVKPLWGPGRMGWLLAMQTVGIVSGTIVVWLLVRLARHLGAPFWAACVAGLAFAVGRRTSGYGPDGISDMLFLSLFMAALLTGMGTRLRWKPVAWAAVGVLAGFSYLTRPEGVAALMILTGALFFRWTNLLPLRRKTRRPLWRPGGRKIVAKCVAVMLLAYAVVAVPYMVAIGGFTGKKPVLEDVRAQRHGALHTRAGQRAPQVANFAVIHAADWGKIFNEIFETFGFGPCIILGIAMALKPRLWGHPHWRPLAACWALLWVAVMIWLLGRAGYLDGRHTLVLDILLFCLFAMSLAVWEWAMSQWQAAWRRRNWATAMPAFTQSPRLPLATGFAMAFLACLPGAVRLARPPVEGEHFMRRAATWLARHAPADAQVADRERLVGYYAGLGYHYWMGSARKPMLSELRHLPPGRPIILDYIYETQGGKPIAQHIGPYEQLEWRGKAVRFRSHASAHGDVLVLYARPGLKLH